MNRLKRGSSCWEGLFSLRASICLVIHLHSVHAHQDSCSLSHPIPLCPTVIQAAKAAVFSSPSTACCEFFQTCQNWEVSSQYFYREWVFKVLGSESFGQWSCEGWSAPLRRLGRCWARHGSDPEPAWLGRLADGMPEMLWSEWVHSKFTLSSWKTKLAPGKGQGGCPS